MMKLAKSPLRWNQRVRWSRQITKVLERPLNGDALAEIKLWTQEDLMSKGFARLNQVIAKFTGTERDILTLLAERLQLVYDGVVAFHGCRPTSLDSYQKHGLLPSNTEAIRQQAFEIFGDVYAVQRAIDDIGGSYVGHNRGTIWTCLTKEAFFLNGHNHYLLEGSEFLSAIAGRLGGSHKLSAIGTPTIVECVLYPSQLPPGFWLSLSRRILEEWLSTLCAPERRRPVCTFCIAVKTPVPPMRILKFHQYREVKRRYSWMDQMTGKKQTGEYVGLVPV